MKERLHFSGCQLLNKCFQLFQSGSHIM
uniref:Uncharacterized protein n=1 Tax=Arundo donax TaxID=35708 RepID=A0A0A8YVQ5_ARUDO